MSETDNSERLDINGIGSYQKSDHIYHTSAIYVYIHGTLSLISIHKIFNSSFPMASEWHLVGNPIIWSCYDCLSNSFSYDLKILLLQMMPGLYAQALLQISIYLVGVGVAGHSNLGIGLKEKRQLKQLFA